VLVTKQRTLRRTEQQQPALPAAFEHPVRDSLKKPVVPQDRRRTLEPVAAPAEAPLEQLVRDELRGPVSELVQRVVVELVREQLNGAAPGPPAQTAVSGTENAQEPRLRPGPKPKLAPAERRCNRCGETKPAGEYAPGRGTCRSCRRAQQREHDRRVALADDEEPHPVRSDPQTGRRGARRLASDRYWNERRRALIEQARVTTEERDGREYVVRHLAPLGAVSE
jgi:hypothetical protein